MLGEGWGEGWGRDGGGIGEGGERDGGGRGRDRILNSHTSVHNQRHPSKGDDISSYVPNPETGL